MWELVWSLAGRAMLQATSESSFKIFFSLFQQDFLRNLNHGKYFPPLSSSLRFRSKNHHRRQLLDNMSIGRFPFLVFRTVLSNLLMPTGVIDVVGHPSVPPKAVVLHWHCLRPQPSYH
jgi:hypothetical protein